MAKNKIYVKTPNGVIALTGVDSEVEVIKPATVVTSKKLEEKGHTLEEVASKLIGKKVNSKKFSKEYNGEVTSTVKVDDKLLSQLFDNGKNSPELIALRKKLGIVVETKTKKEESVTSDLSDVVRLFGDFLTENATKGTLNINKFRSNFIESINSLGKYDKEKVDNLEFLDLFTLYKVVDNKITNPSVEEVEFLIENGVNAKDMDLLSLYPFDYDAGQFKMEYNEEELKDLGKKFEDNANKFLTTPRTDNLLESDICCSINHVEDEGCSITKPGGFIDLENLTELNKKHYPDLVNLYSDYKEALRNKDHDGLSNVLIKCNEFANITKIAIRLGAQHDKIIDDLAPECEQGCFPCKGIPECHSSTRVIDVEFLTDEDIKDFPELLDICKGIVSDEKRKEILCRIDDIDGIQIRCVPNSHVVHVNNPPTKYKLAFPWLEEAKVKYAELEDGCFIDKAFWDDLVVCMNETSEKYGLKFVAIDTKGERYFTDNDLSRRERYERLFVGIDDLLRSKFGSKNLVTGDSLCGTPNVEKTELKWDVKSNIDLGNTKENEEENNMAKISLEELRKELAVPKLELTPEEDGARRLEHLQKLTLADYTFNVYNHARNIQTVNKNDREIEDSQTLIDTINTEAAWLLSNIGGYNLYVNRFGICTRFRNKELIIVELDIHDFNLIKLELDAKTSYERHGIRFVEHLRSNKMLPEESKQFEAAMDTVQRGIELTKQGIDSVNELMELSTFHENSFYDWVSNDTASKDLFKSIILNKSVYDIVLNTLNIDNVKTYEDATKNRNKK